jgi:hypothetical protein
MKISYTKLLSNLKNETLNREMEDWDTTIEDVIENNVSKIL